MSRLDDLRRQINGVVYFSQPLLSLATGTCTIKSGTLVLVDDDITCVVEWDECLCPDEHDSDVVCPFRMRERVSIFAVQVERPLEPALV